MNIKKILLAIIVFTFFTSCKVKSQCEIYTSTINKVLEKDYNAFSKTHINEIKKGVIKLEPLEHYTNQNSCDKKKLLFTFPKDSVFVMDETLDDDYTGTFVNITGIYKNDKVFIFRSTGKDIDTLKIDRDYILNDKYYNGDKYKFILQLKENKLKTKKLQESNCAPLKDLTFVSLIADKKIKKIYRICSGELVEL